MCRNCYNAQHVGRLVDCAECGRTRPHQALGYCKKCYLRLRVQPNQRKRLYGLSKEALKAVLEHQRSRCAICSRPVDDLTGHVDHCHATRRVRGILCRGCNVGVGHLGDDPARLRAAAAYLELDVDWRDVPR